MRIRFALWTFFLGAVCCLTPMFNLPATGFGSCGYPCGGYVCGPCYVYVYVDRIVYVDRMPPADNQQSRSRSIEPQVAKIHFFLAMNTKDDQVGTHISAAENTLLKLQNAIPDRLRGQLRVVDGDKLTKSYLLEQLQALDVGPNDTLFVFCNTHGEEAAQGAGKGDSAEEKDGDPVQNLLMYAKDPKQTPEKLSRE